MKRPTVTEQPAAPVFDSKAAVKAWKRGNHGDAIKAVIAAKVGPGSLSAAIPEDAALIRELYNQMRFG